MYKRYIIVTTENIENPEPDKRSPRDWTKWLVIPVNSKFHVAVYQDETGMMTRVDPSTAICSLNFNQKYPRDLAALIFANSKEIAPITAEDHIWVNNLLDWGTMLIQEMLDLGLITAEAFKKVAEAPRDKDGYLILDKH